jgi:crossover junction endodeoxyribonuclease RusA
LKNKLLKLTIPFPPSVNHYYRRVGPRTLISKRGREYQAKVLQQVWVSNSIPTAQSGPLALSVVAYPPDNRRRDLDNLLKATLDSLTNAGVWVDDSQVRSIQICWGSVVKDGMLEICIECFQ